MFRELLDMAFGNGRGWLERKLEILLLTVDLSLKKNCREL